MSAEEWLGLMQKGFDFRFVADIEIKVTKEFPKVEATPVSKSIITYKYSDYKKIKEIN